MRGFSLELLGFAQSAASFGGGVPCVLEPAENQPHVCLMSGPHSNALACSENRYPSLMARPASPPRRSRPFSRIRRAYVSRPASADRAASREIHFYARGEASIFSAVHFNERAEKCVNQFLSSPLSPSRRSPVALQPIRNARSQVRPQARLLQTRLTKTSSRVRRWVALQAPIATTRAFADNQFDLTQGAAAPGADIVIERLSGACARGPFFVFGTTRCSQGRRNPHAALAWK